MPVNDMGRVPQLDGIRALAVGIVIIAHAGLDHLVPGGFGVTIFFFLSGYLITSLLRVEFQQAGTISLLNFYTRRSLRIIPPLYITLLFVWALVETGLIPGRALVDPLAILSQFCFIQNYAELWHHSAGLPITGVWSLAVEEHFYLIFPLLYFALLSKLTPGRAVAVCLAICTVVLGIRCLNAAFLTNYSDNYQWSHTRIDSILFGSCLAIRNNPVLDSNCKRTPLWQALGAMAVIVVTLLVRNPVFRETIRYTLQSCALYVLFAYALSNKGLVSDLLSSAPAKVVARYSYVLYLVHIPLMKLAEAHIPGPHVVGMIIAVSAAFVYAIVMFRLVERPLAGLRRRLRREAVAHHEIPADAQAIGPG